MQASRQASTKFASPARAMRRARGYTLIELLIVISLMGIMAAVLLPRFEPAIHDQLQGVAQIIAGDLAYARNLAVSNDTRYTLSFSRAKNAYTLRHTGDNSLLDVLPRTPYRTSGDTPDEQLTLLDDLPRLGPAVEIHGVATNGGSAAASGDIEFDALGGLTSNQPITIWLACGTDEARRYLPLTIAPVTGLVEIGELRGAAP